MALPTTISSTTLAARRHLGGPYISSAGNVYVILLDSTDASLIECHKATDPTSSFTEQDSANKPDLTNTVRSLASVQVSDVIHIATQENTSLRVAYHTFNMATDAWAIKNEQVKASTTSTKGAAVDIGVRSDGDVIVSYHGDIATVTMTDFSRVVYGRRESASWTIDVAVDNGGSSDWMNGTIIQGSSDRMHLSLINRTASDGFQRCLRSDNTLETFPSAFDASIVTADLGIGRGAAYVSGGATKVRIPFVNSTLKGAFAQFDSADTPTQSVSSDMTATDVKVSAGGQYMIDAVANLTNLYALWVDASSVDLMRDVNADDAGWGTDATEFTGTVNGFCGNAYTRSGNYKLAYVVLDGTTVKYNELDLGAAAAFMPAQFKPILQAVNRAATY